MAFLTNPVLRDSARILSLGRYKIIEVGVYLKIYEVWENPCLYRVRQLKVTPAFFNIFFTVTRPLLIYYFILFLHYSYITTLQLQLQKLLKMTSFLEQTKVKTTEHVV